MHMYPYLNKTPFYNLKRAYIFYNITISKFYALKVIKILTNI